MEKQFIHIDPGHRCVSLHVLPHSVGCASWISIV